MAHITINKEEFLDDLYNSSSYEEVILKITKEKSRAKKVQNLTQYVYLAQVHLNAIKNIELHVKNGIPKGAIDPYLNEEIAKILKKFPTRR